MTSLLLRPTATALPARRASCAKLAPSEHERRVAVIATRLFDLLAPAHDLGSEHRRLLRTAAQLHDIGRPLGAADHHIRGARMILEDRSLNLTPRERSRIAYLVRHHRGPVPVRVENLRRRRGRGRRDDRWATHVLLGLLRAADALDSRRLSATTLIARRKPRKLRVRCLVHPHLKDEARAVLGRPRKFRCLELVLGLRVQVRVKALPA